MNIDHARDARPARLPGLLAAASLVLLSACTTPSALERDFGKSLASMQQAQTADPATRANPSDKPVTSIDGDYSQAVIRVMRESASKPDDIKKGVTINVEGNGGN